MAKSKITGKTFEEMLSESTELDLSEKFKDIIYEFSNDVHAMGMVVYTYEEENAKFLFKDPDFTKPITDYELLAMYLDEVVATRLVDEDTSLERCRDLENEKVQYYEYKDGSFIKRFYKIGEYYSGETYNDLNGFVPGNMPLVGTAIVGVDKVAENEPVPMQTIWEGTFDATYSEDVGGNYYTTQDIQNGELIKNCNEVTVTFDGTTYTLPVEQTPFGYGVGDNVEPSSDHPFVLAFMVESPSLAVLKTLAIFTLTEGEHTIKVEGAPSGDEPSGDTMRVLYDGEVTGGTVKGDFVYKNAFLSELASMADYTQATITVNNESKTILPVNEVQGDYGKNYILGMDAYPPTELPHDVGVAVVYEVNEKDPTSGGSYVPYIITPSRSKGTQVTSLKVEVDENNKRGDR